MKVGWPAILVLFALATLSRFSLAFHEPAVSGDWDTYRSVAENILQNGCVSLSPPTDGECEPHWGGNQLPGFPAFVALVWAAFSNVSWLPIAFVHSVLAGVAICYLANSLASYLGNRSTSLIAAGLVAISPLTVPWARYTLTETLTVALVVWVLAELIRSLERSSLRVFPLGIACAVAIFVRYDSVLLAVPIALVGIWIHGVSAALKRGAFLLLLVLLPLVAWSLRGVAVGLPPLPPVYFVAGGLPMPLGYLAWGKTWASDQYQGPSWFYPIQKAQYSAIQIPDAAYATSAEKSSVETLIKQLATYDGQAVPDEIDDAFANVARAKRRDRPFEYYVTLPLSRAFKLWWNPRNSSGWPVSLGLSMNDRPEGSYLSLALRHPTAAIVKTTTSLYRCLLLIGLIAIAYLVWRHTKAPEKPIIYAALAFALSKTAFHAAFFFMEPRYLVPSYPIVEAALVCGVVGFVRRRTEKTARNT